ncbi:hypothetical protein ACIRNI_22545 [Streptomyces sp. NPDC093546]|uniref:hypothetical protein n=1 Tax=Streptomyces sp. NPDC093546 TaxID=3366040 RepID=UPI0037FFAA8A
MTPDATTTTHFADPGAGAHATPAPQTPLVSPPRGRFASATVPRHLTRGAFGFGALAASLSLLPITGPASLLLAPVGLIALRGCPMCWAIGLAETVSAGRLRRSCANGRCDLTRAKR